MTTFLRMQPTRRKKKKFLSMKFKCFSRRRKMRERKMFPPQMCSTSCQWVRRDAAIEIGFERENFVIMNSINHSRYIISCMFNVNVMLHFFPPYTLSYLPRLAPILSVPLFTTKYRPELLRMWMFLYAFLHVRFPQLFIFSHLAHNFMLRRTPFSCTPFPYFTHLRIFASRDEED